CRPSRGVRSERRSCPVSTLRLHGVPPWAVHPAFAGRVAGCGHEVTPGEFEEDRQASTSSKGAGVELLSIGRVLSRRRIRVALGLVVAVLIGASVGGVVPPLAGSEKGSPTGQALVRVLIDTRVPLPATTTPIGADTINKRSDLLALEMTSR